MLKNALIIILILTALSGFSQRFLLLEKAGTFRNFKYFEGDHIHIELFDQGRKVFGTITRIADSSFVIDNQEIFDVTEVKSVIRDRFFFTLFGEGAMVAGAFYFSLDVVNRAIKKESPLVTGETAIIGASAVATGWLLSLFKEKRHKVGEQKKWRFRVLSMEEH